MRASLSRRLHNLTMLCSDFVYLWLEQWCGLGLCLQLDPVLSLHLQMPLSALNVAILQKLTSNEQLQQLAVD